MLQQKTIFGANRDAVDGHKAHDSKVNRIVKELTEAGNAIIQLVIVNDKTDYGTTIIYNTPLTDPLFTQHVDLNSDDFDTTEGFDAFERHALVIIGRDPNTNLPQYELDDDADNPDAWGVYIHADEVGITCIAECDTEETAICLERILHIAATKFIR